ncbi:unnamed protein product [Eretmochelys imbricata]
MQAELMHWDPEVIFAGQRCLVYAQLRGQPQAARSPAGRQVAAAGAGGGREHRIGGGPAPGTGGQPELGGRLLPHGLHGAGAAGAGAAGERDVPLAEWAPEESPLLRLVSLQNADDLWNLDPQLAAVLGDVTPSIWATVLAMVWLHGRAVG